MSLNGWQYKRGNGLDIYTKEKATGLTLEIFEFDDGDIWCYVSQGDEIIIKNEDARSIYEAEKWVENYANRVRIPSVNG